MGPFGVRPCQTCSLKLPQTDGSTVHLDADVYTPIGAGPFPVLLMRQPYGRAIASTVVYAHPRWYASHGYIVVIQDVRGRGTSTGDFQLFAHEQADGAATVAWAAGLPHSSGQVGMYGFSYQGMTQLFAAAARPPALAVLAPAMVGYHPYADWAYENGALRLQAGLGWALQLAAETLRRRGDADAFHQLRQAAQSLPLNGPIPARPEVLARLAPDSFFHQWLAHPTADAYWDSITPDLAGVDLPMLHVGGWFDPYLSGDVRLFRQMVAQSDQPQELWVGPWGHLPWGRRVGSVDYGPAADNPIDRVQLAWFDRWLKGDTAEQAPDSAQLPVQLFDLGERCWRALTSWPVGNPAHLYLHSSGLAAMTSQDGHLMDKPPATPSADWWVHDPWRPVPSQGGHSSSPPGSVDRSALDCRSDILTYTTAPLAAPLTVAGTPTLTLWCAADAPSFDLSAVVAWVQGNEGDNGHGEVKVYNLTQGYCRVHRPNADPTQPMPLTFTLQATCFTLPAGDRLRLSVAAADYPAFAVNGGSAGAEDGLEESTERTPENTPWHDMAIVTLMVAHGGDCPSGLVLPLRTGGNDFI